MNIQHYCKYINKSALYDMYSNVIRDKKDYDKITRVKICIEILTYIQESGLTTLITYDEYEPLMHLAQGLYNESEKETYIRLNSRLLTVFDYEHNKYDFLEEFRSIIQTKLLEIDINTLKKRTEMDSLIPGIIKAYGILSIPHFCECISHFSKNDFTMNDFLKTDYYLQYYDYEVLSLNDMILDKRFDFYFEEMNKAYNQFDDLIDNKHFLSKESLLSISEYNIDLSNKINKELYDRIQTISVYIKDQLIGKLQFYVHMQGIIDENFLASYTYYLNELLDLLPLMNKAAENIPSALFHGLSEKQFLKKYPKIPTENSAKLTNEDAFLFFKLFFGLLEFTNKKYKIQPNLSKIYQQTNLPPQLVLPIRDYFFKHLEIVDEFIKKNPYHFTREELKLVHRFKYSLSDFFVIMKYDNEFAYLLGKNANFAVKGLHSTMEEVVPKSALPYIAPMNLIPFKDTIIYDGIIASIPISMSSRMVKMAKDEFKKNTTYYSIYCE